VTCMYNCILYMYLVNMTEFIPGKNVCILAVNIIKLIYLVYKNNYFVDSAEKEEGYSKKMRK
jgi:hypothetical protein